MKIAIDVGKKKSYVVVQNVNVVENEGYIETTKDGFDSMVPNSEGNTFILEEGNNLYSVARILEQYPNAKIVVAHPAAAQFVRRLERRGFLEPKV